MIRIKNWETIYEDHRTRELKRPMEWVPFKISFSGYGYTYLMEEFKDKGAAYFGTFVLLAELAGKSPRRGSLLRSNGTPYEPKGIARVLRISVELVTETIAACSSDECDWLENVDNSENPTIPRESRAIPRDPAQHRDIARGTDNVENQPVTKTPISGKKRGTARSRANPAQIPRDPAKNRATEQNSTEQNNNNTHKTRAREDSATRAKPGESVCESLRVGEKKEIEEALKGHFSEHQMKSLYQLVPGITMAYVEEKLRILKTAAVEKPTAFLWSALVDDYKPKTISHAKTKDRPILSQADFDALPADAKERYQPDVAINGETCYYLVPVHSR